MCVCVYIMFFLCLTGGVIERSTQTTFGYNMVHKNTQTGCSAMELLKVAHPNYGRHSMCDMVLDAPKYAMPGVHITDMMSKVPLQEKKVEVPRSEKQPISSAFKNFHFYPEIRPGKGCKNPRSDMDRMFCVSSRVAINEIYKQEENKSKKQRKEPKDSKGKAKNSNNKASASTSSGPNMPRAKRSKTPLSSSQG